MSTLQNQQKDLGKENPQMPPKEKKIGVGGAGIKSNVLKAGVLGDVAAGVYKDSKQQQGRSNFAARNGNQSNVNARNSKVAFREVSNVKGKDENTGLASNIIAGAAAGVAATKKSTTTVTLEQFKTFSVYEDTSEELVEHHKQQHVAISAHIENAENIENVDTVVGDKENVYIEQQRKPLEIKNNSIHHEYGINDTTDYVLDTTPMSVSEVLSPMSVDRSHTAADMESQLLDESSSSIKVALQKRQPLMPINDRRQRFFEVVEYQLDIMKYFLESEKKHRPKPHYMQRQTDINDTMRTILVDWLVEVSEEYSLDTETLYLSVSYIDRFLSQMSVVRSKLQLVGTAAMYIASKYEEIYPPDVNEFVFITDDTYTKGQVLRMEQIILKILAFDLCTPTAYVYINSYAVMTNMPDKVKFLTQYISELALLEADPYLRFYPSIISAASLALARYLTDYPIWSDELERVTSYQLDYLKEVLLALCKSHKSAAGLAQQAIQEKYKLEKYLMVSTIPAVYMDEKMFDAIIREYNGQETSDESSEINQEPVSSTTNNENVRKMISSLMFK